MLTYLPSPPTYPRLPPSVCKEDPRHSFCRLAVARHDVIATATRRTVSRHTQVRQAPDPGRGLSPTLNHLSPLMLSQTLMPGLRSLTYFYTHQSGFLCELITLLPPSLQPTGCLCVPYDRHCVSRCASVHKGVFNVKLSVCGCSQEVCVCVHCHAVQSLYADLLEIITSLCVVSDRTSSSQLFLVTSSSNIFYFHNYGGFY